MLGEFAIYEIAQAFVDSINVQENPKKLLQMIRKHFLPIYNAILDMDDGMYQVLLACRDEEFTKDYMEKIIRAGKVVGFVERNKLCKEDAKNELIHLITLSTVKNLQEYSTVLYQLDKHCKGLFPKGFTCDVAIVAVIKELRIATRELVDECYIDPDSKLYTDSDLIKSVLSRLNHFLKLHMPEKYVINHVMEVLIEYCGMHGTVYDLKPEEIPQSCDYLVMKELFQYGESIYFSKDVYVLARDAWLEVHDKDEWMPDYKIVKAAINELVCWFDDIAIVSRNIYREEDEEGETDEWDTEYKEYDKSKYYVGAVVNIRKLPYGETFVFDYNSIESRGAFGEESWGEILYIGGDWYNLPEVDGVEYMPIYNEDLSGAKLRRLH